LRNLGTARTAAYFSIAPFFGALLALMFLSEPLNTSLLIAGALMVVGVWLHLTERHVHEHHHEALEHEHEHVHDAHHQHPHADPVSLETKHTHHHRHTPMTHTHPHFPDSHHRHDHE
jgi:ABC-type nickel/cobalt efflux system permease component RcnA